MALNILMVSVLLGVQDLSWTPLNCKENLKYVNQSSSIYTTHGYCWRSRTVAKIIICNTKTIRRLL
ncbi:hypothetical protein THIOM_000747 [Candidatus Thiomargarita nelsonii]|uniref:Uncharacterized protein n=1 Tax=Candidatus Thiomargarita nelsonii TaxID=1003181 RepID=A0A176S675_9GAMM|nr:hypothetical protein THIOM_000747 [Candidatus Thiomargarita nelsonii]